MKYLIFGSGFGLYGYLPAVYKKFKSKVYLPIKYQKFLNSRKDIRGFYNKIFWYKKISNIINKINNIIIAARPSDQYKICQISFLKKKTFFLEKPLANNPENSLKLLNYLVKNNINFNIAYLFNYTNWSFRFKRKIKDSIFRSNNKSFKEFSITWRFKSEIFNNSWKLNSKKGGGIINFYGIHLISLLADLNYSLLRSMVFKNNTDKLWLATFSRPAYPKINILLDTSSNQEEFSIEEISQYKKRNIVFIKNPLCEKKKFVFKKKEHIDYRANILTKYLYSKRKKLLFHKNVIFLWKDIMKNTRICYFN
jgi:hypothetical protein